MANNSLLVSSLDFDTIKANLKTHLQSQSTFRDYDFEGSNMNVLLSVLAYNTYINSFYLNMVAAESFLDSAQLKDSVISHAKMLNYTPRSSKSSKATLDVTFYTTGVGQVFEIPKGTQFSSQNSNGTYNFVTDKSHSIISGNNIFAINNLEVFEGSYINETFVVDNTVENQRFYISNPNIDTTSLQVTVYEDNNLISIDYASADNLFGVTSNSAIYFLQAYQNQYELVFGDGVFGRPPKNNSTILATYRISNGADGGGAKSFTLSKDLGSFNGGTATTKIITVTP